MNTNILYLSLIKVAGFHEGGNINRNFTSYEITTPKRKNQEDYKPQFSLYRKSRKRIETLFSQLRDQFMVKMN